MFFLAHRNSYYAGSWRFTAANRRVALKVLINVTELTHIHSEGGFSGRNAFSRTCTAMDPSFPISYWITAERCTSSDVPPIGVQVRLRRGRTASHWKVFRTKFVFNRSAAQGILAFFRDYIFLDQLAFIWRRKFCRQPCPVVICGPPYCNGEWSWKPQTV